MQHEEQIRLLQQSRELVTAAGTDLSHPGGEVPIDRYTDPERLERERQLLFRSLPLLIGFSSQVRAAGDCANGGDASAGET